MQEKQGRSLPEKETGCGCVEEHAGTLAKARQEMPDVESLYDLSELFKVFGDTTRIRILWALAEGEMCVCDLAELLEMGQSAVSHQLRLLRQARLIENIKKGRWVYYRLPENPTPSVCDALAWLEKELADNPQILQDAAALPGIFHNKNIHAFLEHKHIPAATCGADGVDGTENQSAHSGRKSHV